MKDLSIPKNLSFAAPYGLFVALLYLFAFWGTFNLNILEFVGFADLAKLALYPLAASFIFLLMGVAISELVRGDSLPPGGWRRYKNRTLRTQALASSNGYLHFAHICFGIICEKPI
jgi:hypothetical protein